ncbi:hypothetical protein D3Z36_10605 [Lachnospiraceae bacterium]|nr:hypothetical protein [Lachnospiraceae bacterium]
MSESFATLCKERVSGKVFLPTGRVILQGVHTLYAEGRAVLKKMKEYAFPGGKHQIVKTGHFSRIVLF